MSRTAECLSLHVRVFRDRASEDKILHGGAGRIGVGDAFYTSERMGRPVGRYACTDAVNHCPWVRCALL